MTTTRNGGPALTHRIGERGELTLRVPSGRMEVTGVDGDEVSIRDLDGRDLAERFVVERDEGRLTVRPHERVGLDLGFGRRGRGRARLAVQVPRDASVSLETANGDLAVHGLRGEQRYRTASGDIQLVGASGPIGVDGVSGDIRIEGAGAIELSGRLVSGDLDLRGGSLRSVALATTSGDITLDAPIDGPGPFSIQTVSGDALVASSGNLRVEARTLTGDIGSDLEHRMESGLGRRDLVIGNGARTLAFRSISGDLRIAGHHGNHRHPADAAPAAAPPPPAPAATALEPPSEDAADPRLAILRELEAGAIDVETATARLAELEEAPGA